MTHNFGKMSRVKDKASNIQPLSLIYYTFGLILIFFLFFLTMQSTEDNPEKKQNYLRAMLTIQHKPLTKQWEKETLE